MTVNNLFMVVVQGTMIIQDRERNQICKVETGMPARDVYKTLMEADVLNDEVHFIEVAEDTMYITIK